MKETIVKELIGRGREAMSLFLESDQARVDEVVTAIAWSIYQNENATQLARQAVENTGLGNVPDKIAKNQRKTFGTLRDLLRVRTVGIIDDDPRRGIVQYAKPVGVVAAITPSTNPVATPVNKAMMAVKGRNAVVIGPSPAGWPATATTVDLIRQELSRVDAPADLVQVLPAPVSKERTRQLMSAADLVVVTGSQNNVKSAYSSGTPAIGVGAGNVPVVIDSSADLAQAAQKICASKTFDNSTSCSSENAVILIDDVSSDRSADIVEGFATHDPRFRLVRRTENVGPGFARNQGIDLARGRFVLFIDPDDYMPDPGHLQRVLAMADADKADMVRYRKRHEQIEDEQGTVLKMRRDATEAFFPHEVRRTSLAQHHAIAHSRHFWNWLYRRDFLNRNQIRFLTTYREERAFLLQAYMANPVISLCDSDGVVYRIRSNSAVRRAQTMADVDDQLQNFDLVVRHLRDHGALDPGSPHWWLARFQVSQFLHYLYFGFAWKTAKAEKAEDVFLLHDRDGGEIRSKSQKDCLAMRIRQALP